MTKKENNNSCKYKLLQPTANGKNDESDLIEGKDEEQGIQRIQALLADWLRMENVVVLTAAGCSVSEGGRLMAGPEKNNLEHLVLNAVEQCNISEEEKAIIAERKDSPNPSSFEEWLSYLFNVPNITEAKSSPVSRIYWKGGDNIELSQEKKKNIQKLISRAIYAECALEIRSDTLSADEKSNNNNPGGHFPFLAKLIARDSNLGRTHLFTLNYDTLFEQALEELGIQYFDGFTGKASARFDPSVYGLDIYYPGDVAEGRVRRFDKFLQFYKLHGSIHWSFDSQGICRAQHKDLSFAQEYRDANDPKKKAEMLASDDFSKISRFGILPTSQKFSQTLDMPYAHLFRLFHARLNQPQTFLLVLGYGFGDEHVNRIIETALTNPSLVMLVVEPNPESKVITERLTHYQNLGQRVFVLTERCEKNPCSFKVANTERCEKKPCSFKVANFADFAQNIMPDVKWLDDFKRLRQYEREIAQTNKNGSEG